MGHATFNMANHMAKGDRAFSLTFYGNYVSMEK